MFFFLLKTFCTIKDFVRGYVNYYVDCQRKNNLEMKMIDKVLSLDIDYFEAT